MRIESLGTGGFHPNERRHTACVMLPDPGVVFDAGTGFFRVAGRLRTDELHVLISHAHLDHVCGLTYLIAPLVEKKLKRVTVHGAGKYLDAARSHLFAEPIFPILLPEIEFAALPDRLMLPQDGVLTHRPLPHPNGSLGFRIDWPGRSMAYITDTVADGSYLEFIQGVDVLIHECNFPDSQAELAVKYGHSFTSAAAHAARDAGVGRLLLVHVDPQLADDDPIGLNVARGIFPATELAEDGMEVEF